MPIDHEAKVRTKDGHEAGHVKHAIWMQMAGRSPST